MTTPTDSPPDNTSDDALVARAKQVQPRAYAPYSNFSVGAAVLAGNGTIYTGVNVENASYPVGICAERTAIAAAVTAGESQLSAIALITPISHPVMPCGMCAQALFEFNPEMRVIAVGQDGSRKVQRVNELLPHAYDGEGLWRRDRDPNDSG